MNDRHQRRTLGLLLASVLLNAIFCKLTVFGNVFVLFLDHLGLDKARIGFVLSLIPFAGLVALVVAPRVARFGAKRTYVTFFGARKAVISLLLFTPAVLAAAGAHAAFWWVVAIVGLFGLCRAIGEVGGYALFQDIIPNEIRGRFGAASYVAGAGAGLAVTLAAGAYLAAGADLRRYLVVIGAGTAVGVLSVICLALVPPERAPASDADAGTHLSEMREAVGDRRFMAFIGALCLASLAVSTLMFVPLFLKERVGISPGLILWIDSASAAGALLSSYRWGHWADTRGGGLVMRRGLALMALAPPLLLLLPALPAWRLPAAMLCAVVLGCSSTGWLIGADRYLLAEAVPEAKRSGYIAVFYSLSGLSNGVGPIAAGAALRAFSSLAGGVLVTPYLPILLAICALTLAARAMLRSAPAPE